LKKLTPFFISTTWRVIAFAIFAALLVGSPSPTAQSSPSGIPTLPPPIPRSDPAVQGAGGPYLAYLPFVAKNFDLAFSQVKIIQGTSPAGPYAVYAAGRATTVRAFATYGGYTVSGVTARIYGYDSVGNSLGFFDSAPATIPSVESDMSRTLNFNLPQNWLLPGYSFAIVLDPNNLIPDPDRSNNRYPAAGTVPFNFSSARPIEVVIVPIAYTPYGGTGTFYPTINDTSYLQWMMPKVDPAPYVTFSVRGPVFENYAPQQPGYNLNDSSGLGWQILLNQIAQIHDYEDLQHTKLYYGVVNIYDAHNGCNMCYTGLGFIGQLGMPLQPTAVGWSGAPNGSYNAGRTLTHEAGHNYGREHVLCLGTEASPDPNYPYAGGKIGVWGLDVATGSLYDPNLYADYMSYCPNLWTSDYTFAGIKQFREQSQVTFAPTRASATPVPSLYVSGIISPTGQVNLRPVYEQLAPVNVPSQGTHTLQLLGSSGNVLAAHRFTPTRTADAGEYSGFGFFVPSVSGLNGIRVIKDGNVIGEKIAGAPMGTRSFAADSLSVQRDSRGTHLRWSPVTQPSAPVVYRVRLSRDAGATWQVLTLDSTQAEFTAPPTLNVANTIVEVQATDGIHVTTRTFDVH
jgi:hypothetical protein